MLKNFVGKVTKKDKLTDKVYQVVIETPESYDFDAGQFMSIEVAQNVRRSYSLSNMPLGKNLAETLVDISPGGVGSKYFQNLKVGDEIKVLVPLGRFVYKKESGDKPVLFFSTGTGLAPFVSMVNHSLKNLKEKRMIIVNQGVRYISEVFLLDELLRLSDEFDNFKVNYFVSRPESRWDGPIGRINNDVLSIYNEFGGDADVYICGGTDMIQDTERKLIDVGFNPDQIYYEKYY